jgi:para-nitrobenzyl esterase
LQNYKLALVRIFGDWSGRALELYPAGNDEDVIAAATELASDRFLGFSTWRWVEVHGKSARVPTFYYYYSRPRPAPVGAGQVRERGAVHSAEIEYAMGNLATNKVFAWTPDDYEVSRVMQSYFVNFIKRGNPNAADLPRWDDYQASPEHPRLTIDVDTRQAPDNKRSHYRLIDAVQRR